MVNEAEKYKQADEVVKKRIEAKNALENYCYSVRGSLKDEKIKDKFSSSETEQLERMCSDVLKWIETNTEAPAEEFESKQKEIEAVFNPIITRVYQQGSGSEGSSQGGMPGGMPGGFASGFPQGTTTGPGPKVDEVD